MSHPEYRPIRTDNCECYPKHKRDLSGSITWVMLRGSKWLKNYLGRKGYHAASR